MSAKSRSGIIAKVVRYMESHPGMTASLIRRNMSRHGVLASDVAAAAEQRGYEFAPSPTRSAATPGLPALATPSGKGRSMTDFKARYDLHYRVEQKVAELLPPDGDTYYEDAEFRDLCDIHPQHWRRVSEDSRFQANRVICRQCNVWAPTNMVARMKHILGIV